MQTLSVPVLGTRSPDFQKITSQQITVADIKRKGFAPDSVKNGQNSTLSGPPQDTQSRMTALGKALKKLLDPSDDRLLPGYAELIQLVKSTTVAAKEEKIEEERLYYEAKISRFGHDRRQRLKKDDQIRDFLLDKKADIYDIIKSNMAKLKVFPENESLISGLTAEQQVEKVQKSLRNPQVEILANLVRLDRQTNGMIPSHLSPQSRRKLLYQRQRHASQEHRSSLEKAQLLEEQEQNKAMVMTGFGSHARKTDMSELSRESHQLIRETRDLRLSDLGTLLEDLEVIEIEDSLHKSQFVVPGQSRKVDEDLSKNKQMMEHILERPSLSELLSNAMEKNDREAYFAAERKFSLMRKHSTKMLGERVNTMLGLPSEREAAFLQTYGSGVVSPQASEQETGLTPSIRALHQLNQIVSNKLTQERGKDYKPFLRQVVDPQPRSQSLQQSSQNDSYRYVGLEAILHNANSKYRFADDIDNSEEEELTDDELRDKIKARKAKEKARRDDLTMVKVAAVKTAFTVEQIRKQIPATSVLDNCINLEALKERQVKLRGQIDSSDYSAAPGGVQQPQSSHRLNQRSGEHLADNNYYTMTKPYTLGMQTGYEPCDEADEAGYEDSSSDSSEEREGGRKDPMQILEREMLKYRGLDAQKTDQLDRDQMNKYEFKASFISHICAVKDRQHEYKARLKTFDHKKSTHTNMINQQYLEKKIYESVHKKTSQSALGNHSDPSASQIIIDQYNMNKRSMSSIAHLSSHNMHQVTTNANQGNNYQQQQNFRLEMPSSSQQQIIVGMIGLGNSGDGTRSGDQRATAESLVFEPGNVQTQVAHDTPELVSPLGSPMNTRTPNGKHIVILSKPSTQAIRHRQAQSQQSIEASPANSPTNTILYNHDKAMAQQQQFLQNQNQEVADQVGVGAAVKRGPDLSCVNSSNLVLAHQNVKDNPAPPFQAPIIQNQPRQHSQINVNELNNNEQKTNTSDSMGEVLQAVENQFSQISLKIVLSPRGQGGVSSDAQNTSNKKNLAQSHSQQQHIFKRLKKEQESTVTVLGATTREQIQNFANGTNQMNSSSKAVFQRDDSPDDFTKTKKLRVPSKYNLHQSASNIAAMKPQGTSHLANSRSLLGTRSSVISQSGLIMEQKLDTLEIPNEKNINGDGPAESPSKQPGLTITVQQQQMLIDQNSSDFNGQVNFNPDGTVDQSTVNKVSSQFDTQNHPNNGNRSPTNLDQRRSQPLTLQHLGVGGSDNNTNGLSSPQIGNSPTFSKLNTVDLNEQNNGTLISFENKGSQIIARASKEAVKVHHLYSSINSKADSSVQGITSPHFLISPRGEPQINGLREMREMKTQMDTHGRQTDMMSKPQPKKQLQQTQFDFPLPPRDFDPNDLHHQQQYLDMNELPPSYKQKMLKRFGGSTSYGQGFLNIPKNSSFYGYRVAKEIDMNKTTVSIEKQKRQNADLDQNSRESKHQIEQSQRHIVAREVSVGSNTVMKETIAARTNLLGPTEYLSLSSGYATPEDDRSGPSKRHRIMIQDEKHQTTQAGVPVPKNIVKLELKERNSPQHSTGMNEQGAAMKNAAMNQSPNLTPGKTANVLSSVSDNLVETLDSRDVLKPLLQGLNSQLLNQIAIKEEESLTPIAQRLLQKELVDKSHTQAENSPITARIKVGRKQSVDSQQMIETQGMASHLNLADAATSPPFKNTSKPPTPLNELNKFGGKWNNNQNGPIKKQGGHMKGWSNQVLNNISEQLEINGNNHQLYKAKNPRKLSISILTSQPSSQQHIEDSDRGDKNTSGLRISPSQARQTQMIQNHLPAEPVEQVKQQSQPLQKLKLQTPHLQPTNVKIALQKEKSKRMIQILSSQNRSVGPSEMRTQSQTDLYNVQNMAGTNKYSGAGGNNNNGHGNGNVRFISPKQIDLGLNLGGEFHQHARATQEFLKMSALMQSSQLGKDSSNRAGSNMKLAQQTTEANTSKHGEFTIDSQGQFVNVMQRNASQLENPLLHCSEEDETVEALSTRHQRLTAQQEGKEIIDFAKINHMNIPMSSNQENRGATQMGSEGPAAWQDDNKSQAYNSLHKQDSEGSIIENHLTNVVKHKVEREMNTQGEGASSQVKIENDIKEMQGLLPPLLSTTSTKQFFKNDEIKLQGEDRKRAININRQESVPLQYVRDSSKMSDINQKAEELKNRQQSKFKNLKQARNNDQTQFNTTGQAYTPTPLSILQENPVASDFEGAHSLLRQSMRGSETSGVALHIKKQNSTGDNDSIIVGGGGPYLRSRVKLPNLNRSQYTSSNYNSHQAQISPQNHHNVTTRSSIKNVLMNTANNIKDGFRGQRIANNFQVKIKKQLHHSLDPRKNINRTHVMDSKQRFIDLHQSARNTESFGMQVHAVGKGAPSNNTARAHDLSSNLQQQKLIYGGHTISNSPINHHNVTQMMRSSFNKKTRDAAGKQQMHKTLTQVLMPPIDVKTHKLQPKVQQPAKSLLLKVNKGIRVSGSQTSRLSPNHQLDNSPNKTTQYLYRQSELSKREHASKMSTLPNEIESGQIDLSPVRRIQLAAELSPSLIPAKLPFTLKNQQLDHPSHLSNLKSAKSGAQTPSPQHTAPKKVQDAGTRVKMASIKTDSPLNLNSIDGENALQSQGSSRPPNLQIGSQEVMAENVTEIRHQSAVINESAAGAQNNTNNMYHSQASYETLALNKQGSIATKIDSQVHQKSPNKVMNIAESNKLYEHNSGHSPLKTDMNWSNPQSQFNQEDAQLRNLEGLMSEPRRSQFATNSQITESSAIRVQEKYVNEIISRIDGDALQSEISSEPLTKEQVLFMQHQESMQQFKQEQYEMQYIERFYAKPPISMSGQNDISNSVWIDNNQYSRKKKPDLLLKDLADNIRNGKIEQGQSPFNVDEFIRMDGTKPPAIAKNKSKK